MEVFYISDDENISIGMSLSGMKGITLKNKELIENKIDDICKDKKTGILFVTKGVFNNAKDKITNIQENQKLPIIVKIPSKD